MRTPDRHLPARTVPMDGAVLWTHPYRRTGGAKPGINPIWEVPGNQPNPGHRMTQEREMASAEMTASRYISQPRLLTVRVSRGQIRVCRGQIRASRGPAGAAISAKMTATGKEEAVSRAETANISPNTRPSIRPSTSLSSLRIRKRTICCCMLFGVVFGVLGIIFAIMSKKGERMDSQAKAGLILSIIGVAATVLIIIFFVVIEVLAVIPELN